MPACSTCLPCSLDLNPIEQVFAQLKAMMRRAATRFLEAIWTAVGTLLDRRCRKRIEEVFGRIKASAGLAKIKLRGRARVDAVFTLGLVAYNLARLPKLLAAPA